jgi:CheY-like chemotaxis protein
MMSPFSWMSVTVLERHPDISVTIASPAENALKLMDRVSYDVIVSDYQMPGTNGPGFLKIIRDKNSPVPFILFTCRGYDEI